MATVVALVSQKGGVGKSTLSRALAREAAAGGLRVKVADLDTQQGTSVDWHRVRLSVGLEPVVSVEAFATAAQALAAADGFDLLVIDGPARTSQATLEIAKAASIVVQPTGASLDDLRPAVREFHALVKAGVPAQKGKRRPRVPTSKRLAMQSCPVVCLKSLPTVRRRMRGGPSQRLAMSG